VACTVVTVSRTLAAGGEEIGRAVAQELGFRYVDEEIIIRAAEKAGVSPQNVSEREHEPGIIKRILQAWARTPPTEQGVVFRGIVGEARSAYQALIVRVIREIGAEGGVVIVAHAASVPLSGMKGLLRSFITAPRETRVSRLVRESKMAEAEARKAVEESDRQRREYLRRFYDVSEELPTHYDVVLNTDTLPIPVAAQLLIAAARAL
jgi:cytidylate kinase